MFPFTTKGILDLLVVSEEYNFTKSSMSRPERTRIMGELHTLLADTMAALPGLLENYVQQLAALSPAEQQVFGSTLCPRIMALNELCTRGFAMLLRALKAAAKLLVQRQSGISRLRKVGCYRISCVKKDDKLSFIYCFTDNPHRP